MTNALDAFGATVANWHSVARMLPESGGRAMDLFDVMVARPIDEPGPLMDLIAATESAHELLAEFEIGKHPEPRTEN
jgi:hypothetical protein